MGWISEIVHKTQTLPIAGALIDRLTQPLDNGYVVENATLNYHAFLLDRRGREYLVENDLHRFDFESITSGFGGESG